MRRAYGRSSGWVLYSAEEACGIEEGIPGLVLQTADWHKNRSGRSWMVKRRGGARSGTRDGTLCIYPDTISPAVPVPASISGRGLNLQFGIQIGKHPMSYTGFVSQKARAAASCGAESLTRAGSPKPGSVRVRDVLLYTYIQPAGHRHRRRVVRRE